MVWLGGALAGGGPRAVHSAPPRARPDNRLTLTVGDAGAGGAASGWVTAIVRRNARARVAETREEWWLAARERGGGAPGRWGVARARARACVCELGGGRGCDRGESRSQKESAECGERCERRKNTRRPSSLCPIVRVLPLRPHKTHTQHLSPPPPPPPPKHTQQHGVPPPRPHRPQGVRLLPRVVGHVWRRPRQGGGGRGRGRGGRVDGAGAGGGGQLL